ncbi:glycoside hydrolase family 26 protein [Halorhodospira halophila]|uniref:Endoglucanase, family 26 n=1 Tax=Halorhodospira halophila (strain DSM 244 / SL1) TaxID=349124 RepID=A1WTJ1_HALHL|nr:glycosyl hydrolase [Halorhodospira halophila]ABM61003.1 endoglucanase, family 26 [Halorhodospira halophila SL1]MBK1729988.1 endoglucanase [Halorhodospira halophila]
MNHRRLIRWAGGALICAHGLLPAGLPAGSAPPPAAPPVAFGVALDGAASRERLAHLEQALELEIGLVAIFIQFPEDPRHDNFPAEQLDAIRQAGGRPVLTWEPMYIADGEEHAIPAEELTGGAYDAYIRRFARGVKAFPEPVIIRFAHEMNLDRYHWGSTAEDYGPSAPTRYRAMFRHVVEIFRDEGAAEHARFAFNPNAESVPSPDRDPDADWNRPEAYYPGDAYVDVLGMDGYNWGTTRTREEHGWDSRFQSFQTIFEPLYRTLRDLAPDKPIYVFETATVTDGGDKAAWIEQAAASAVAWELAGLVWFHNDKEENWRLDTGVTPEDLEPLRRMITDPEALLEGRSRGD